MHLVFFILGGNLGDKPKIFFETISLIVKRIGEIIAISSAYETESWGFESELFLNQALIVETELSPVEVLSAALEIEKEMGRMRKTDRYESRSMDIDLLFYDDICLETPELILPHPRIAGRRFVLEPLAEIAPDKKHPVTGLTVNEMLNICPDKLKVKRIEP
jgi:2-amino-4-hydroxy-6-hydroxymethyldihydropteridine diphosphokinase